MKKLFSILIVMALLTFCSASFASVGIKMYDPIQGQVNAGQATDFLLPCDPNSIITSDGSTFNVGCNTNFVMAGIANGGYTSMTTSGLAVPVSFAFIKKAIAASANTGFSAGTLANGVPGQHLTIQISYVGTTGTFTITPVTSTGWTSITFNTYSTANPQIAEFEYINNTVGWIIVSVDGSTLPTITDTNGK